ncbi:MAG: hypothetical protein J7M38_03675 [Armatimonadetes bacterium]|nr:hypothetical protein [Armatimonadota bacterium]
MKGFKPGETVTWWGDVAVRVILFMLALFAAPFWETTGPREWSDAELQQLLHNSPWARTDEKGYAQMYLASARPMREAEAELRRRNPPTGAAAEDPTADEYAEFMRDNPGAYIVLAVQVRRPLFLEDPREIRSMENKCVLEVGKRKYKMVGHFPPTAADPYLRLVFPRVVKPSDKMFFFELYVPGVPKPFRRLVFGVKDLYYRGKLEL